MKIAVIGNSHTGALKRAWPRLTETFPDKELTFFAARSLQICGLELDGQHLVPSTDTLRHSIRFTSGGKDSVALQDYDAFLIYGVEAPYLFLGDGAFYSAQILDRLVAELVEARGCFKLLDRIRAAGDRPVYVGHDPLPAARRAVSEAGTVAYETGINFLRSRIFEPRNATLVAQPLDTIAGGRFTQSEYSKGSQRLEVGDKFDMVRHAPAEILHMNDDFGELWLRQFLANL